MSHNEKDPLPPPYSPSSSLSPTAPPRGQTLLDQLTLTRARHIRSVIDTHILPLVKTHAAHGIARTVIALLPSDIPSPTPEEKSDFGFSPRDTQPVEVVGFSSDEAPRVVRLGGPMNGTEFWRARAVVQELQRVLRERLDARPQLQGASSSARGRRERGRSEVEAAPLRAARRGFLSRLVPSLGPGQVAASGNPEVEVESGGAVLVAVRVEEVCLRTVTEFGLYDTVTRLCVVVRVDARC